jgi:hypothetical protein
MINWINIKDELPSKGEYVLTYGDWGIKMDVFNSVRPNGEIEFNGTREEYNTEVTHWARINLPE